MPALDPPEVNPLRQPDRAQLQEQVNMLYDGLADDTAAEENKEWAAMACHCTCGALHR